MRRDHVRAGRAAIKLRKYLSNAFYLTEKYYFYIFTSYSNPNWHARCRRLPEVPSRDRWAAGESAPGGINRGRTIMQWQTPSYDDIRFGFEVTMYINNR